MASPQACEKIFGMITFFNMFFIFQPFFSNDFDWWPQASDGKFDSLISHRWVQLLGFVKLQLKNIDCYLSFVNFS